MQCIIEFEILDIGEYDSLHLFMHLFMFIQNNSIAISYVPDTQLDAGLTTVLSLFL
jgi:hypothetical protein